MEQSFINISHIASVKSSKLKGTLLACIRQIKGKNVVVNLSLCEESVNELLICSILRSREPYKSILVLKAYGRMPTKEVEGGD